MRYALLFLCLFLIAGSSKAAQPFPSAGANGIDLRPYIILDNDGGGDIDDMSDRRMMNSLVLQNKIHPLADIECDSDPYGVSSNKAAQNFMGVSYPLYSYQGNDLQYVIGGYTQGVTSTFNPGDSRSNYSSSLVGYRTALASAPNNSVILLLGGPSKCLDDLLNSAANTGGDGLPSGLNLILTKVKYVMWTAGTWPTGVNDFNLNDSVTGSQPVAAAATQDLFQNWPAAIPFYFYGVNLTTSAMTGPFPSGACTTSGTDPFQLGYFIQNFPSNPCVRELWAQPTFFMAIYGIASMATIAAGNQTAVFNASTNTNTWSATPGPFSYLANAASQSIIQTQVCTLERFGITNWC